MQILIRTLAWVVGLALVAIIGLSIAVSIYFDPNDYRDDIESVIESRTGRDASIEGELSLSLLPCCAIEIGRTTLSDPAEFDSSGFANREFLAVDSAAVSIGLFPLLLRQEIEIGEVVLEGVRANLRTTRRGEVNWEFSGAEAIEAPEPAASSDGVESGDITMPQLSVAGLQFTDAEVRWHDQSTGDDILVTGLNVTTGAVAPGQPFDMHAEFLLRGLAEGIDAAFSFDGRPVINDASGSIELNDSTMELVLSGSDLPEGQAVVRLQMPEFALGDPAAMVVAKDVTVELVSGPLTLNADATGVVTDQGTSFSGALSIAPFSPRDVLELAGESIDTADPEVLQSMDVAAKWVYRGDRAGLSEVLIHLDDTSITGELGLGSIEQMQVLADIKVDSINLDRYLTPAAEEEPVATTPSGGNAAVSSDDEILPVDTLRELNLQGRFDVGELVVEKARLTNLSVSMIANDGQLRMYPLVAEMYDGTYSGDVRIDVRGEQPKLAVAEALSGVNVGELLQDMEDIEDIVGTFDASIAATARGNSEDALLKTLNGDLRFRLADGAYQGRDFWYEIRATKKRLEGKEVPPAPADPKTDISTMRGSGKITNGILQNNDFEMAVPFIRMNGAGQVNLPANTLDYRLDAKVIGSPQFEDGEDLSELRGLTLPVTISGDMSEPNIVFDLTSVITGLAAKKLQDRLLKKYGGEQKEEPAEEPQEPVSEREQRRQLLRKGIGDLLR